MGENSFTGRKHIFIPKFVVEARLRVNDFEVNSDLRMPLTTSGPREIRSFGASSRSTGGTIQGPQAEGGTGVTLSDGTG